MYVEIVERDITNRGHIIPLGELDMDAKPYERYMSLFPYDEGIVEYVVLNKTVAGYEGLSYCPVLFFDVDNESLITAKESAAVLATKLCNNFRIRTRELYVYFSGAKGFHIGIHQKLFGNFEGSPHLIDRLKRFVSNFINENKLKDVDMKIYDSKRIFRVSNSLNKKTGLYKIPITYDELTGPLNNILSLAKNPRTDFIRDIPISDMYVNEVLVYEWEKVRTISRSSKSEPRIEYNSNQSGYFHPPQVGSRNSTLYKQAAMLFSISELGKKSVTEIIQNANALTGNPLLDDEIESLIESAYKKAIRDKCAVREEEKEKYKLELKSIGEWGDEYLSSITPVKSNLLTLPFIDDVLRHRYRGKLMICAGFGGTKKSILAQNIVMRNAEKHNARSIYSSMEMGVAELIARFINMGVEPEDPDHNPSVELESLMKDHPDKVSAFFYNQVAPMFSNQILVTQDSSMNTDKYRYLIRKAISETGKVDILAVDGLSMMESTGKETHTIDQHTKELKELAKEFNIFVVLIVHVSRGAEKTSRDLTSYARGSEKISDNCDFFLSLSYILNEENSTEKSVVFEDELVYARLWDKRGSGKTVDKVLRLNTSRLWLDETDIPIGDIENRKPKKTKNDESDFRPF